MSEMCALSKKNSKVDKFIIGISAIERTNGSKNHIPISGHPVITANMVPLFDNYKTMSQLNEKKPHDIIICNQKF